MTLIQILVKKGLLEKEKAAYKEAYEIVKNQQPSNLYSTIGETLHRFKKAGINMIVVSSDPCENLLGDINQFNLKGLFNEINCDIYDKAENIEETIKRNGFNPKETIFIGDTTHEIKAGKKAGTLTAAVTWGFHNEDKLKSSKPDFIIRSLEELESMVLSRSILS